MAAAKIVDAFSYPFPYIIYLVDPGLVLPTLQGGAERMNQQPRLLVTINTHT